MNDVDPAVERDFRFFATMCEKRSPLYAALSAQVAEAPGIMSLVAERAERQSPANLLFGAVHHLLLGGAAHDLAGFYPSIGGTSGPDGAWPAFTDFCRVYEHEIRERVRSRTVQTNEVGRCAALMLAGALAFDHFRGAPFFLVEIGAAAGLTLLFDRYQYVLVNEDGEEHVCGAPSQARVRTGIEHRDGSDLPPSIPVIAHRVGIDLAPVDVTDGDAIRWVQAMIYPDQVERIALFLAAVDIARQDPPKLIAGDGLECLPDVLAQAPDGTVPCIMHSRSLYQMSRERRAALAALIDELGAARNLARVSLEWLGDDPGPVLSLTTYTDGSRHEVRLADCHDHGAWIRWHGTREGRGGGRCRAGGW